jgi:hypothetical protein
VSLLNMTPLIHHLNLVWEIHLSLIRFATRSFPISSLSQYYQIIGCVIHMFKRSPSETSIKSAICSFPFSLCRPSLCPVQFTSYSISPSKYVTHFMSLMGDSPPVTSYVPSTSAHYLESRLRNIVVPWSLHASMVSFLSFDSGFTSLTPD